MVDCRISRDGCLSNGIFPDNILYPLYYPEALGVPFFHVPKIIKMFAMTYPVTFVAAAIKLLKYWCANKQAQQILAQEKLQAELQF